MPCDLSADSRYVWDYDNVPQYNFTKQMVMAPRFHPDVYRLPERCLHQDKYIGFSLKDRLLEYAELFDNQVPSSTWWGWAFFKNATEDL
jgi:hypothetical protein